MSLKAIISVLVLGTSSAALAHPIDVRDHRDDSPIVRDHRDDSAFIRDHRDESPAAPEQDLYQRRYRRPITLASSVQLTSDFRDRRGERPLYISVDRRLGGISKLRFDMTAGGRAYIDTIVVMLPNGQSRTYTVRQMMSSRSPSILVDLDQRSISGIYVYGSSLRSRGTFDVIGMRGGSFERR